MATLRQDRRSDSNTTTVTTTTTTHHTHHIIYTYNRSYSNGPTKLLGFFHNLATQFTCGCQDEHHGLDEALSTLIPLHVHVKGRQEETTRLARARLGNGDQVFLFQREWPSLRLNGRGFVKAGSSEGRLQTVVKGGVGKVPKGGGKFLRIAVNTVPPNRNTVFLAPIFRTEFIFGVLCLGLVHGPRAQLGRSRVGVRVGSEAFGFAAVFRVFQLVVLLAAVLVVLAVVFCHDGRENGGTVVCYACALIIRFDGPNECMRSEGENDDGKKRWLQFNLRKGSLRIEGQTAGVLKGLKARKNNDGRKRRPERWRRIKRHFCDRRSFF